MNIRGVIQKYKNIATDFFLNILASLIITVVTQIIIYPWLAGAYSADIYGIILTIMGVGNTIVGTVGNSLNNVRLLMKASYEEKNLEGDFLPILFVLNILSLVLFYLYFYTTVGELQFVTIVLLLIYLGLGNARGYGVVTYRLKLNFRNNLICSIAIAAGNIIGIVMIVTLHITSCWPLIFVLGEVFGIIVLMLNSKIFSEPFKITSLIRKTSAKVVVLMLTTLVANILIYLDRFLLLPILGGEAVSTYTTASFFGKCLGLLLTPMAGVLLGYYAQSSYSMTKRKFRLINFSVIVFGAFFFLVSLALSKWVTGILYPALIDAATPFLLIGNLTAIIASVGNMTTPAVLKFAPTHFQIIIQIAYCIVYFGAGYFFSIQNGLWGFSIAAMLATCFRLFLLYIVGEIYIRER